MTADLVPVSRCWCDECQPLAPDALCSSHGASGLNPCSASAVVWSPATDAEQAPDTGRATLLPAVARPVSTLTVPTGWST